MALRFSVLAECPVTKARAASMVLCHHTVETPVFMPVGTQGSLKGMTSQQLAVGLSTECQIMLGNTYHLANKPVSKLSMMIDDCPVCTGLCCSGESWWFAQFHGLAKRALDSE